MEKLTICDNEKFLSSKIYFKVIKHPEWLIWSGKIFKVNKHDNWQKRLFLMTESRLINLGNTKNILDKLFGKLVRRSIQIYDITHVTYSEISNNFVVHVPRHYDYWLCTQKRDEFLLILLKIWKLHNFPPVTFYFVDDIELKQYSKTDEENYMKYPKVEPKVMDDVQFEEFLEDRKKKILGEIQNT